MTIKNLLENTLVFDTETTSKDFKIAEVIEFSAASLRGEEWEMVYDSLFKPSEPISAHVSAVNHITNKHVEGQLAFSVEKDEIQSLLNQSTINVAHNIFYDNEVLKRHGVTVPNQICTMRMAKKLFADYSDVEAYNLSYLRYLFELDIPEGTPVHRAAGDVLVTCKLFEFLLSVAIETGALEDSNNIANDLLAWIDEPIISNTMPFGKYKGQSLDSIPLDYWSWALANIDSLIEDKPEFDKDFAASVQNALDKIMSNE